MNPHAYVGEVGDDNVCDRIIDNRACHRPYQDEVHGLIHLAPLGGMSLTQCCMRTPFELGRLGRLTTIKSTVTCPGVVATTLTLNDSGDALVVGTVSAVSITVPKVDILSQVVRDHRLQPRWRSEDEAPSKDYECECGEMFMGVAEWSEHVAVTAFRAMGVIR